MKKLKIKLGKRSYSLLIGSGALSETGSALKRLKIGKDAFVITNSKIWRLYGRRLVTSLRAGGFTHVCEKVPDRETSKSNKQVVRLIDKISRADKRRGTFIVAFGGGVVGDLAGFVASIYKRGIPYIQIPTTLLGQVDSAIGGKVAIDLDTAKNLVGAFYQPRLVVSDISLLKSLPAREIISGLGEIIKYGIIADRTLFGFLERDLKKILKLDKEALEYLVYRCSKIKARIVEKDELDRKGLRAILNYGHTIGHALEAAAGYSKLYTHGEAVAIGMATAAEIACRLGMLKEKDKERIELLIKKTGLPVKIRKLKLKRVIEAQMYDKKIIHGVNRFVLPTGIGKVRLREDIPKKLIWDAVKKRGE